MSIEKSDYQTMKDIIDRAFSDMGQSIDTISDSVLDSMETLGDIIGRYCNESSES